MKHLRVTLSPALRRFEVLGAVPKNRSLATEKTEQSTRKSVLPLRIDRIIFE
ncbi:MAG: hypothetical protein AAFP99_03645 [Pseudomonadota bacterium]